MNKRILIEIIELIIINLVSIVFLTYAGVSQILIIILFVPIITYFYIRIHHKEWTLSRERKLWRLVPKISISRRSSAILRFLLLNIGLSFLTYVGVSQIIIILLFIILNYIFIKMNFKEFASEEN